MLQTRKSVKLPAWTSISVFFILLPILNKCNGRFSVKGHVKPTLLLLPPLCQQSTVLSQGFTLCVCLWKICMLLHWPIQQYTITVKTRCWKKFMSCVLQQSVGPMEMCKGHKRLLPYQQNIPSLHQSLMWFSMSSNVPEAGRWAL